MSLLLTTYNHHQHHHGGPEKKAACLPARGFNVKNSLPHNTTHSPHARHNNGLVPSPASSLHRVMGELFAFVHPHRWRKGAPMQLKSGGSSGENKTLYRTLWKSLYRNETDTAHLWRQVVWANLSRMSFCAHTATHTQTGPPAHNHC